MKIVYTGQQKDIIKCGVAGMNMLIQAYAGCSKSTTLEHLAKHMSHEGFKNKQKLMIAFNVRAKKELEHKMGGGYRDWQIKTFNGLGHSVLLANKSTFNGGNLSVQAYKMERLIDKMLSVLRNQGRLISLSALQIQSENQRSHTLARAFPECDEFREFLLACVTISKVWGILPNFFNYKALAEKSANEETLLSGMFDGIMHSKHIPVKNIDTLVNSLLNASLSEAKFDGIIDFADQIYLSVLFCPNKGRQYDVILGDEIQDASLLNNQQIERAAKGQVVLVGDDYQTIYQFRGAMPGNMAIMGEKWQATTKTLGVTFRCPIHVVNKASALIEVKDFKAFEKNKRGNIQEPYFSHLNTRKETVGWRPLDIIKGHLRAVKKNPDHKTVILSSKNDGCFGFLAAMLIDNVLEKTDFSLEHIGWSANSVNTINPRTKSSSQALINAYLGFLSNITGAGGLSLDTLANALQEPNPDSINRNFVISTVHRYKGLEGDHVYIYNPEDFESNRNLFYVAITRTRNRLAFLNPNMYSGSIVPGLENAIMNAFDTTGSKVRLVTAASEVALRLNHNWRDGKYDKSKVVDKAKAISAGLREKGSENNGRLGIFWNPRKLAKTPVK